MDPGRTGLRQQKGCNAFGQSLEQIEPLLGQRLPDRINDRVVGQDPVHVVRSGPVSPGDLHLDIEAHALGGAPLRLERANLHVQDIIPDHNAVARGKADLAFCVHGNLLGTASP